MTFDVDSLLSSGLEQDAVITTASGTKKIKTIFDNEFAAKMFPNFEFEGNNPVAACRTSDVEDALQDDPFETEGLQLKVRGIHPDGQGLTIFELVYA